MGNSRCLLILTASASLLWGCDADAPTPPALVAPDGYHQPTSPDSVVANLILAHNKRDRAQYAALLAPEFRFFFTSVDIQRFGESIWNKSQDSTGTAAMFHEATDIDLIASPAVPTEADPNLFPPGTQLVRLHSVQMTVLQPDRVFFVVTTDQDLYLRLGNAATGEDPTHWFISEWHEIEPLNAAGIDEPTPVSPATWGQMKYRYLAHADALSSARP
jgi:hypothetical protein